MANILTEKEYQRYIIDYLVKNNGFIERKDENFDRYFALDKEMLFKFLNDTQPDEMDELEKIYKDKLEETLVNYINNQITSNSSSIIEILRHGVYINGVKEKINLMYTKPATSFNKEENERCAKNIFSVAEEVWANDEERIDLVIFLNGFAIMSFELKCNTSGQNYENAIIQYRTQRDPKSRLFMFEAGCFVNFAMDMEEVYMTTKLDYGKTYFLPFNKGKGEGVNVGKGNPLNKDGFGVSYMWEDILTKDTILELISKFIFIERTEKEDPITGKIKKSENIIFPRYHQIDCLRKTLADVKENHTSLNYLIQHSAGSGKTYTIAWLAHRLATLHDDNDKQIYDNVIIVTDRVVVDRQLQKAVTSLEHKSGFIRIMDDKCSSDTLKTALESNTKIIATTIQKFLYIAENVKKLKNKHFAVLIDEAHSSTSGKDMAAVTKALGSDEEVDPQDIIIEEIQSHGKQANVSMFAFTATPKATTLNLFGRLNPRGEYEAFHLYSMKQAIEEGFILDVLQNFTPYQTFYRINKEIESDPKYKTNAAKKKIARFAMLHETNISQRIEIIIEHFRNVVMEENAPMDAKAMVVTGSRAEAVKYYKAFLDYVEKKQYKDIQPLVAFTGKVKLKDDDTEYSESQLNGFSEAKTQDMFDTNDYQVLLVANKYQTGFDQPKLCAMYVLKSLKGVAAVQTLSRLNRICPPYDKKTFILDFVNSYEDIVKAFEPYYTTTLLCNNVTPQLVYELENKIDGYYLFGSDDCENVSKIMYDTNLSKVKKEEQIMFYLGKAKRNFEALDKEPRKEAYSALKKFVRFYEFLLQVCSLEDQDLYKKYKFICLVLPCIKAGDSGYGFDLSGKIDATNFYQKKGKEEKKSNITPNPNIKLAVADAFNLTEDEEKKLSDIIKEVNSKTGNKFDKDVAVKAALQVKDLMMKNEELVASAKNNTVKDFEFSYYDNIDEALVEGINQNRDFFTLLLKNSDIKKEVLGIFLKEIYESLRA